MENCNHEDGKPIEHLHPEDVRFEKEILISDLYHILDLAGKLLNKKDPDQDDVRPYEEFMRYAQVQAVADKETEEKHVFQYVDSVDVPKIILGVFVGQADEKRTEVTDALKKHYDDCDHGEQPKHVIEHIVDQVWEQYSTANKCEVAPDFDECKNFVLMCLDVHEQTLANEIGREQQDLNEAEIDEKIKTCKKEADGTYTKESMNAWIVDYCHNVCQHVMKETTLIIKKKITE